MVIDVHTHLGDILELNGCALITQEATYPNGFFLTIDDMMGYRRSFLTGFLYKILGKRITLEERRRNYAATLTNARAMLDQTAAWDKLHGGKGESRAYIQPIAPYVTWQGLQEFLAVEPRLRAFGSPDFTLSQEDMVADLQTQAGAYGLKIHPIIQNIAFDNPAVFAALEQWQSIAPGKPVLFHSGTSKYYMDEQRNCPERSDSEAAKRVFAAFPKIPIILGHAGLFELEEWGKLATAFDNIYADGSFQGPTQWKVMLNIYGENRLLYASDWPYGKATTAQKSLSAAFSGDLLERILWRNAADLGL